MPEHGSSVDLLMLMMCHEFQELTPTSSQSPGGHVGCMAEEELEYIRVTASGGTEEEAHEKISSVTYCRYEKGISSSLSCNTHTG